MITILLVLILAASCAGVVLQVAFRKGRAPQSQSEILSKLEVIQHLQQRAEDALRAELQQSRTEAMALAREGREEQGLKADNLAGTVHQRLNEGFEVQRTSLEASAAGMRSLRESIEGRFEAVRQTVEGKLKQIQDDNAKQLDQMRATVEEKLQGTLESRLGEAFKQVSDRLDQVHKGLGEMQTLATGVGDLKRVFSNVKIRGGWGEVQLGALLEEMLTPTQFERNVRTRPDSQDVVEFAIKLPGQTGEPDDTVWLPVDSKFPVEDYQRLIAAQESGDAGGAEEASKALAASIVNCAKVISTKYLNPPQTTNYGIMFLPTEGLFAEVIRRPGLIEKLQREWRVSVAGPTTFAALLNSLQMGFRTLTIQKQSSEVWKVLGKVKTEFAKFGGAIEAVKKKLDEASNKIAVVDDRTRAVNRSLRGVESVPEVQGLEEVPELTDSAATPLADDGE